MRFVSILLQLFLVLTFTQDAHAFLSSRVDLSTKEDVANKDIDGTLAANSDVKYPSQKAVKTYVDATAGGFTKSSAVCDSYAGMSSTNTRVPYFTNERQDLTSSMNCSDATNGAAYTTPATGGYAVTFSTGSATSAVQMAITLDGSALSTDPATPLTYAEGARCGIIYSSLATLPSSLSCVIHATVGQVIKPQSGVVAQFGDTRSMFTVVRVY